MKIQGITQKGHASARKALEGNGKGHALVRADFLIGLSLVVATLAVYWQVTTFDFVNFDDDIYVTKNPHVAEGLSLETIAWAFRIEGKENTYWHPLTWLSHALDVDVHEMVPGAHHLTNVLMHVLSTLLLFLTFKRMTRSPWKSAFVAALFALHPLNVDSVAWIAQRKNLLSTFFFFSALFSYVHYTVRPSAPRYLLVLSVFCLGLMAKPMLVTFPFLILLLDYWPLGRFTRSPSSPLADSVYASPSSRSNLRLIAEKIPFALCSALSAALSYVSQDYYGVVISEEKVPLDLRIENALVSYVSYISKMIWPFDLSVYYPYPTQIPLWSYTAAGAILVTVSLMVLKIQRARPYVATGWLWYMGTLVPVLGILQIGLWPAMADRWTYIPMIGMFVILSWGVPDLLKTHPRKRPILALLGTGTISILALITTVQLQYWKDSSTLFRHALDVTLNNYVAHNNYGNALLNKENVASALVHYSKAVQIRPSYEIAQANLGLALFKEGKIEKSVFHLQEALRLRPDCPEAHANLAKIFAVQGRLDEAIYHYRALLALKPNHAIAHNNLGVALMENGKRGEALFHFQEAVRLKPDNFDAHCNLARFYAEQGEFSEAFKHYAEATRLRPNDPDPLYQQAELYMSHGQLELAKTHYEKVISLRPDHIPALNSLVEVHLALSRYDRALAYAQEIVRIRPESPAAHYNIASIFARQGSGDDALYWLRKAVEKGFSDWDLLMADKNMDSLRDSSFLRDLLGNKGLQDKINEGSL